ncbi:MAG: hypothetical protein BHW64_04015 [Candidatus Melainabacteria bacterium LEY3_CP_29_8]|nr:MAG: hypothetical protein BHW64_04015 [Candidatus Melainabacteria bacterium LEY3_CP_29_8]
MILKMTINKRIKGQEGEKIACDYLEKNGYEIIETNYHYSKFQLDVVSIIGFNNPKIEHLENVGLE